MRYGINTMCREQVPVRGVRGTRLQGLSQEKIRLHASYLYLGWTHLQSAGVVARASPPNLAAVALCSFISRAVSSSRDSRSTNGVVARPSGDTVVALLVFLHTGRLRGGPTPDMGDRSTV